MSDIMSILMGFVSDFLKNLFLTYQQKSIRKRKSSGVKTVQISASLLGAVLMNIRKEIISLEKTEVDMLHIDVMDGNFVPNITFGMSLIGEIKKSTSIYLDVHLMTMHTENYVGELIKIGVDHITIHPETCDRANEIIHRIKAANMSVGIALSPNVSIETLHNLDLQRVDVILIMSVEPGFGGQKFVPETLQKIKKCKKMILDKGLHTAIQVDGGINEQTALECIQSGADILVAGTAIFNKKNRKKAITALKKSP